MTNDYSLHITRLNRQWDSRLRRALERFSGAVTGLENRIEDVEEGATPAGWDTSYIDLDTANQTEDIDPPTGSGQWLLRVINTTNLGTETYTATFLTNLALMMDGSGGSGPDTFNTAIGDVAGEGILCCSGYYNDTWCWIRINSGFTLSTV